MGKRKEYRKIIKNYKEQKIVFQEEMKLDYSKLEETIAEAIKIEKERENENQKFEIGKMVQIGDGTDATVFATGVEVAEALKAKEELEKENINIRVVDVHTIKPIDREMIIKCARETKKLITIEDHSIIGGLGTAVCEVLSEECPTKVVRMGMQDRFGKSGKAEQLLKYFKLDSQAIIEEIKG